MAVARQYMSAALAETAQLSDRFVLSVYERFDSALRSFFMSRLRNEAEAQDYAQEVYLRFIRMDDPRRISSERAFIFTTANNLLRDRSRRLATQLRDASIDIDEVSLECASNDPAVRTQHAQELELLDEAIKQLGENCREAFWMSRVEGLSYSRIAETMGVSVSMVEKHISSALRQLRAVLED